MNKKLNNILNGVEILAFLIIVTCFTMGVIILPELKNKEILRAIILIIGNLSAITMISIEIALFLIGYRKCKIMYILYMLADLALVIMINNVIPFAGVIVFCAFNIIKGLYRSFNLEKIYEPNKFEKYLKIYSIELKSKKKNTRKKSSEIAKKAKKNEQVATKKAMA